MVLLMILDGWGHGPNPKRSAIATAHTPFIDDLYVKFPNAELLTHGENVGLPRGQMGNSEVGHINIGAGRVVYQELARINNSIEDHSLANNKTLLDALEKVSKRGGNVHLCGLVSDGGVHSHINHLKALIDIVDRNTDLPSYIHAFTDGRDCDPKSGLGFVGEIEDYSKGKSTKIATIIGRYYAMDRDRRWERIKKAYDLMVDGKGEFAPSPMEGIQRSYENEITDEFIEPIILDKEGTIKDGDLVVFFNFRTDRPRQLTTVLTQKNMPEFEMNKLSIDMITFTNYDDSFDGVDVLYEKEKIKNSLGEVLEANAKSQLRIAETEKYPHVTFFFSGGREVPFEGEERILVASPKVATYDLQPEMSAEEITTKLLDYRANNDVDFVCLNFANADMVGHTGDFEAAVKSVEKVDECVKKIIDQIIPQGDTALIIADHGNSDYMVNDDGSPHTAHTTFPVPVILVSKGYDKDNMDIKDGILADVAPTILDLLNLDQPSEMTGESLIVPKVD